ncbi:amino acid ABC transporter substrate-binding protein [Pseudomonas sp. HMWF032]|uniref:substrate-binding periplasmic protein n=1 Tax=Pseudomonas sp. HMWF032 TaxID=2056866 RepID=UPI000D36E83F|nr:transporter substrate-binding domain-containing protein [Pseudomonas sp. HMWF032]PTS85620.1 amino acid ABC transporter substrate-binding protein [Pseudomonas sp. HMWF032]PTT86364.1 amino acid ABC transporter substrate-binding protein [Pseudomonas sp. HMWF010]
MSSRLGNAFALISLCLLTPSVLHADAKWESLDFITEEFPPYNYTESGIAKGITVDILLEAAAIAGLPIGRRDIRSLPWARGYQMARKGPGVLLFSMARTDERGPQFKWVGPIMPSRIVLLARKDRQLQIKQPAELSAYRIGVIRDDASHQLLNKMGISDNQLQISASAIQLANLLHNSRIDLWAYNETTAYWFIRNLDMHSHDFAPVHVLKESAMYYAFSLDTDAVQLTRLQNGLNALKKQPRYQEILDSYK